MQNNSQILIKNKKLRVEDISRVWSKYKISKITKIDLTGNDIKELDSFINNKRISVFSGFFNLEILVLDKNPIFKVN